MELKSLAEWDNFYVIVGSSAAALTGLTFVVIALARDASRVSSSGFGAFITPSIFHFGVVFAIAAHLSVPHQNVPCVSYGIGIAGIAGLIYAASITRNMHRFKGEYMPVLEDWIWHVTLPACVYAAFFATAFLMWRAAEESLYCIGALSGALLFIGIHNSWDVAVSISLRQQNKSDEPADKAQQKSD